MAKCSEVMTREPVSCEPADPIQRVAEVMKRQDVGAVPIVDAKSSRRLVGILTDRDIVVKCLADGRDPARTTAGELGGDEVITIGADDSVEEALRVMKDHAVRRLPVIDGRDLVGVISLQDIARNLSEDKLGDVVDAITT